MKKKRVPVLLLTIVLILGMLTPQTTLAADDGAAEPEILVEGVCLLTIRDLP